MYTSTWLMISMATTSITTGRRSKVLLSDQVSDQANDNRHVPSNYIRPISDRPNLNEVVPSLDCNIPVIDVHALLNTATNGDHIINRSRVIHQIGQACQTYGFFQIKNHGIAEEVIDKMLRVSKEFFHLPESERLKNYSDDPMKTTRLSTSFNVKTEKLSNWRDFLRLHCYPLEDYMHEWPSVPPTFRGDVSEYCRKVREVAERLVEGISESLGLKRDYIKRKMTGTNHGLEQHMALNYYPKCPQPELTYGLPAHADPNLITILLQDDVPGLQVLNNGKWLAVYPIPYTFIVNISDQLQVVSNDRYKSVLHRAVVNNTKERISIPTFFSPSQDAIIRPANELIDNNNNNNNLPVYRNFTYAEYYKKFWNRGLAKETCLDMFKTIFTTPPLPTPDSEG